MQEALTGLVAKRLVGEERMEDGRRVFGMNEERRKTIIDLLEKKSDASTVDSGSMRSRSVTGFFSGTRAYPRDILAAP